MNRLIRNSDCFILDRGRMEQYIEQILKIEKDTSYRLGVDKYGAAWTKENFLSERAGKWEFSTVVITSGEVMAYLVSSTWLNNLHGHRMAMQVDLDTGTKVMLQKQLYEKQRQIVTEKDVFMTTAMVPAENSSTIRYYLKEGWLELNGSELLRFIEGREMNCFVEPPNTLVDKIPEDGHPSRAKVLKFLTEREPT